VGGSDADDDPIYGTALNRTWGELLAKSDQKDGRPCFDFSVARMQSFLEDVDATGLSAPPRAAAQLTPLHLELLVQTEPAPMYEPDVAALLHGFECEAADVQIVWRQDLPIVRRSDGQVVLDRRETVAAQALLVLNPPSSLEAATLPVAVIRSWLSRTADQASMSDVEGARDEGDTEISAAVSVPVLVRRAENWNLAYPRDIRPGDAVVVPSEYGACDEYGFAPNCGEAVKDLSSSARARLQRSALLVLTANMLANLETAGAARAVWRELADTEAGAIEEKQVDQLLASLDDSLRRAHPWLRGETVFEAIPNRDGVVYAIVIQEAVTKSGDLSDEDMSSSRTVPVALHAHNQGVGTRARELGTSIKLPQDVVETLGAAGTAHDWGKADPRFQQMLRAGGDQGLPGVLLAKSRRTSKKVRTSLGERHEAYSVALIKRYPQLLSSAGDPELALYLVGTHHGRGRPLMPERTDAGIQFRIDHGDEQYIFEGAPELGALGSGWPSLFWALNRRYGPWGVAYLEAVLRLADWLRSVDELQSGGSR
jgi:CRISPR-associated endonuclease/helicase Cas3